MPAEITGPESAGADSQRDDAIETVFPVRDDPKDVFNFKSAASASWHEVREEVAPEHGGGMAPLERRRPVLETPLADAVQRHESAQSERATLLSTVEENLLALRNRLEQSEKLHASVTKKLRVAVSEARTRLDTLETAVMPNDEEIMQSDLPPLVEGASFSPLAEPSQEPDEAEGASKVQSYLDVARRAANASIMQKNEREAPARKSRAKLLLAGCLAPMVIVAATVMVLNRNPVTAKAVPAPAPAPTVVQASAIQKRLPAPDVVVSTPADPMPAQSASALPIAELQAKADAGDTAASRDLGLKYLAGDGLENNDTEAARWLMGAAYKGEPTAEYWLGTLYARGKGVPADAFQAGHWYEAAAMQGNVRAMHNLAVANFQGTGRDKNDAEAAQWFEKAAQLGFVESQFNLAIFYERGTGVERNLGEAYKWYAIAGAKGDKEALGRVAALAQQLKPEELARARSAAAAFKAVPMDASANAAGLPARSGG